MISEELKMHFANLYRMALSDDNVHANEIATLVQIAKDNSISEDELNEVLLSPVELIVPKSFERKIEFLCDYAKIIIADGKIDENERRLMEHFVISFGFEENNATGISDFIIKKVQEGLAVTDIIQQIYSE